MATEQFQIVSLFQGAPSPTIKRKDSGASEAVAQLSSFKGFGEKPAQPSKTPLKPVTLTFTPSTGSTCISLYPRTKTFTFASPIDDASCIATCENEETWRISAVPPSPDSEAPRFNFERMSSLDTEKDTVKEAFRRCSVATGQQSRRQSSVDLGRRLSVGHYSSGLSGFKLPYSPKA